MDRNVKKLLCAIATVLLLTACRSGGGETTVPSELLPQQTTVPTVTIPEGEGVEDWDDPVETDPVQTTEPQENVTEVSEGATEPQEDPDEPQTDPTEPRKETNPTEPDPADPTDPQPTEPPATTQPQAGGSNPADLTYEEYLAMSPYEQQAHYEQFTSLEAYIAWHNAALAEYEENQSSIEVTGGIDIGDFMNP